MRTELLASVVILATAVPAYAQTSPSQSPSQAAQPTSPETLQKSLDMLEQAQTAFEQAVQQDGQVQDDQLAEAKRQAELALSELQQPGKPLTATQTLPVNQEIRNAMEVLNRLDPREPNTDNLQEAAQAIENVLQELQQQQAEKPAR